MSELPIDSIIPDPNQPRKHFDETTLQELAESIKQNGLLQSILVKPVGNSNYQIVHGERRWKACCLIGLKTIKAEIRELNDKEVLEIQLVENLQRENLNPIEEARTFKRLLDEFGYTHEGLANRIGKKSREYVSNKLRLLNLPDNIQEELTRKSITEGHARTIIPLEPQEQRKIVNQIIEKGLNVRETEDLVNNFKQENVSRETSIIPNDGLIIGVWVSTTTHSSLLRLASSRKTTVENLCSQIIEKGVMENE